MYLVLSGASRPRVDNKCTNYDTISPTSGREEQGVLQQLLIFIMKKNEKPRMLHNQGNIYCPLFDIHIRRRSPDG